MDLQSRQRSVGALLAVGAALLGAPTCASAASASDLPGGFGVRPVLPKGQDLPPSYFIIEAGSGSVARRSVVIINGTKRTKRLIVDGVDALTGETTGVVYANRQRKHREASRWVRPRKHFVRVGPGEVRRLRFTVRVPKNVRPGDHVAGLAFEDAHAAKSGNRFAVRQVVRVVVGIHVKVRGGDDAQADVGRMQLRAQPGTQVATTTVRLANRGDRLCKPTLRVELARDGERRRTVERKLETVLPHDVIDYPMQIPGVVKAGTYDALARVTGCGEASESAAAVTLASTLDGSSPRADAPGTATLSQQQWPLFVLLGLGVLAGSGLVLLLQRLLRRRRPEVSP